MGVEIELNKEKRSLLLLMILGDGCLHRSGPAQRNKMGYISIKHGWKQKDYLEWKADLISKALNRPINISTPGSYVKKYNKTYPQVKIQVGSKRMRAWRRFCYPNNKKDLTKILPFITHDLLAATIWLCDDGSQMTGRLFRNQPNSPRVATGLILYLGDVSDKEAEYARQWWKDKFNVNPRIRYLKTKYKGGIKIYPQLNFKIMDALWIWKQIRKQLIPIESMWNKFKLLEQRSQRTDLLQPQMRDYIK